MEKANAAPVATMASHPRTAIVSELLTAVQRLLTILILPFVINRLKRLNSQFHTSIAEKWSLLKWRNRKSRQTLSFQKTCISLQRPAPAP
jgi:hypothetical protein